MLSYYVALRSELHCPLRS